MFYDAHAFNQDINDWDVSSVTNMRNMFYDAKLFNQSLNNWNVKNVDIMTYMFIGTRLTQLPKWTHGRYEIY